MQIVLKISGENGTSHFQLERNRFNWKCPYGGNKHGKITLVKATMLTMILGGLWHGASWNFVIWGFVHGLAILIHKFFKDKEMIIHLYDKLPSLSKISGILLTQIFVFWTWLIFRIQDDVMLAETLLTSSGYNADFGFGPLYYNLINSGFNLFLIIPSFLLMHYVSYKYGGLKNIIAHLPNSKWCLITGMMLSVAIMLKPVETSDFIYFRF